MSQPQRIQRKRTKGWKAPEGAVYVGRGSVFGNPFTTAEYGDNAAGWFQGWLEGKFMYHYEQERRREILRRLPELRGKTLMCWCRPGAVCHADVLIELIGATNDT